VRGVRETLGAIALAAALLPAGLSIAHTMEAIIEAPGPLGPLRGALRGNPDGGVPLILIIPGSGPTDRDGNSPLGVRSATYRLLAEGLEVAGIASVRIDKRGMHGSAGATADPDAVTISDYAADIASWVRAIRAQTMARCVVLLGHSEGGLVALAAAQVPHDICGTVLVATPGRPLGAILRGQLQANPANTPFLAEAAAAIAALERGERIDEMRLSEPLRPLFRQKVQPFLIDLMAQDPARSSATVGVPMLILQGARDIQVGVDDARRLHAAAPRAELVLLPSANHVLKSVDAGDRAANLATYGDPALPLADGVIEAIAGFIRRLPPAR
jgi:uncharacterized protein